MNSTSTIKDCIQMIKDVEKVAQQKPAKEMVALLTSEGLVSKSVLPDHSIYRAFALALGKP